MRRAEEHRVERQHLPHQRERLRVVPLVHPREREIIEDRDRLRVPLESEIAQHRERRPAGGLGLRQLGGAELRGSAIRPSADTTATWRSPYTAAEDRAAPRSGERVGAGAISLRHWSPRRGRGSVPATSVSSEPRRRRQISSARSYAATRPSRTCPDRRTARRGRSSSRRSPRSRDRSARAARASAARIERVGLREAAETPGRRRPMVPLDRRRRRAGRAMLPGVHAALTPARERLGHRRLPRATLPRVGRPQHVRAGTR